MHITLIITIPLYRWNQTYNSSHNLSATLDTLFTSTLHTLIPLKLIKSNRDSVRKAWEAYLIERLMKPLSLEAWIRKMKCNTFFPFVFIHPIFNISISLSIKAFHGHCFHILLTLTFPFLVHHVIVVSHCMLSFSLNCNVVASLAFGN